MQAGSAAELLTTTQKARRINLDAPMYGTFAEIGAGQEVAREFFHAGGASGTIAKSISAYDMVFSDAIYGKSPRYVSRERLSLMLDHEYALLLERLRGIRGERTNFFVFADTVATGNHQRSSEAHGWLGIRFQAAPMGEPSEILLHVRMWDNDSVLQQQALGIVGVNLIYGALYLRSEPRQLIESLQDNLGTDRIEVDMLRFSGSCFEAVDNRLMSLHLVECKLTKRGHVWAAGRSPPALGNTSQESSSGRKRQFSPGHTRQRRHDCLRYRAICAGIGGQGQGGGCPHGNHHEQPALRRRTRRE